MYDNRFRLILQGVAESSEESSSRTYTDIAVIILIGQEKIHLKRCIEKLAPLKVPEGLRIDDQLDVPFIDPDDVEEKPEETYEEEVQADDYDWF